MHVLFVHRNYPAQFGHVAEYLARERGWRCTFVSELEPPPSDGGGGTGDCPVERIRDAPAGAATQFHSFHTRGFENAVAHAQGVFDALKGRRDLRRPDLVVGHSGFGSTIFLRELFDCPIVNYFEYFYRSRDSDIDFRPDVPPSDRQTAAVAGAERDDPAGPAELRCGLLPDRVPAGRIPGRVPAEDPGHLRRRRHPHFSPGRTAIDGRGTAARSTPTPAW